MTSPQQRESTRPEHEETDLEVTGSESGTTGEPEVTGTFCSTSQQESSCSTPCSKRQKRSRENTLEEKKRMRNDWRRSRRKKARKCKKVAEELRKEIGLEHSLRGKSDQKAILYKHMSRSYWERWNWELQKRKEAMALEFKKAFKSSSVLRHSSAEFHEIDPDTLSDPEGSADEMELYIERGSFGVVKLQVYRGIYVAVKELLPKTVVSDVCHEARILMKLCHPYVPYLFGVCTKQKPYRLVLQFHGVRKSPLTVAKAITQNTIIDGATWLMLSAQLMEALCYLHSVNILHNDIITNNVLLNESAEASSSDLTINVVLIDFGKASLISNEKRLRLSGIEKAEYTGRYPHIAPEVIEGEKLYSCKSDVYAFGGILFHLPDHIYFSNLSCERQNVLLRLANKCHSTHFYERPTTKKALAEFEELLQD